VPAGTVGEFAIELDLTLMFIKTNPSLETWGTTVRLMPTLIFSVATAVPAAAPLPLAMLVELGSTIRRTRSLLIVEGMLFKVTTEGREMIFTRPSFSAAERSPWTL